MQESGIEFEVNELFATLKNSHIPTVLVEGKDDMIFYRRIEEDLSDLGIDILSAGNKEKVLKVREKIISENLSLPIVFVVDKDLWVNYGIPQKYQNKVLTSNGYSIENDMFIDGELLSLLDKQESVEFNIDLEKFIKWYALAVDRSINNEELTSGESFSFRHHPNRLLDDSDFYNQQIILRENENYPDVLYTSILSDYATKLRGKSLLDLLLRYLSQKKRKIKFGRYQLLEIGASRKGKNYQRLAAEIRNQNIRETK